MGFESCPSGGGKTHGKLRSLSIETPVLSGMFLFDRESLRLIVLRHIYSEINTAQMIGSARVSTTHTHYTMIFKKYIINLNEARRNSTT